MNRITKTESLFGFRPKEWVCAFMSCSVCCSVTPSLQCNVQTGSIPAGCAVCPGPRPEVEITKGRKCGAVNHSVPACDPEALKI